jgi:hypothetical protein
MDSKSIFASKTLWLNLLGPLFTLLAAHGLALTPDQQLGCVGIVMSGANIVMRLFTNRPVHVVTPSPAIVLAMLALVAAPGLSGCALYNSVITKQPLTPAAVQADFAMADYLLKASCPAFAAAAAAAAPIVTLESDAQGQQVFTATSKSGAILCATAVSPTALPAPVPANTAPVVVPPPAA